MGITPWWLNWNFASNSWEVCDRRTNKRPWREWVVDVRAVPTRSPRVSLSIHTPQTYNTILLFYWKPLAGTRENGCAAARNRRQPSGASLLVPKLCDLSAALSHMLSKRIYGALFAYPTRRGVRLHQYAYLLRKLGHISLSAADPSVYWDVSTEIGADLRATCGAAEYGERDAQKSRCKLWRCSIITNQRIYGGNAVNI